MISTKNSGILLVNKEAGYTSRKVGNMLSRQLGIKKGGHLGTLDPFATGLLIFAVNEGTKVLPFLEDDEKTYVATLKLGLLTSTLDPDGEIILEEEVKPFRHTELIKALEKFSGTIKQTPPLTSAIRIDGKRAYKYAHAGHEVLMPEREVTVHNLRIVEYIHPFLVIEAVVSKGTYIRTLGQDIAKVLGTNATTVKLVRTKQGDYSVNNAKLLSEVKLDDLVPVSTALHRFPIYRVNDQDVVKVKNGRPLKLVGNAEFIQIHNERGILQAIYRKKGDNYIPVRGFNL